MPRPDPVQDAEPKTQDAQAQRKTARPNRGRTSPDRGQLPAKVEAATAPTLVSMIGRAILDPNVNDEKLTRLIDWYDKRQAANAFARDYLAMAKELPEIKKDGTIDQGITKSGRKGVKAKYATHPNIHEVCMPILTKHGFTLSTWNELRGEGNDMVIVVMLEHFDPQSGAFDRKSYVPVVRDESGGKTAVQAIASGEAYLIRRMFIKMLNLRSRAPEDSDHDGTDPAEPVKVISAEQLKALKAAIAVCGVGEETFCNKYEIASPDKLPVALYNEAMAACARFKEQKEKRKQ